MSKTITECKKDEIAAIFNHLQPNACKENHPVWERVEKALLRIAYQDLIDLHILIIAKK